MTTCTSCGSNRAYYHDNGRPLCSTCLTSNALWPEKRMDAISKNGNDGLHYDAPGASSTACDDQFNPDTSSLTDYQQRQAALDAVNRPAHYQSDSGIECIDAIKAAIGEESFVDHCRATAIKYCWRSGKKTNHAEDLRKAAWYLTRAAEELE